MTPGNIDHKIREKLDSFSEMPPPSAWEGIQSEIAGSAAASSTKHKGVFKSYWKPLAAALVIGAIAYFVFFLGNDFGHQKYEPRNQEFTLNEIESTHQKSQKKENIKDKQKQRPTSASAPINMAENSANKTNQSAEKSAGKSSDNIHQKKPVHTTGSNAPQLALNEQPVNIPPEQSIQKTTGLLKVSNKESTQRVPNINFRLESFPVKTIESENLTNISSLKIMPLPIDSFQTYETPNQYSLGFYVNSDKIYNSSNTEFNGPAEVYGFGLTGRYQLTQNHFVETGVGLYQTQDRWDYTVDYRALEVVDYYEAVDSISYKIVQGSSGQDSVVPTYYTHEEPIMDSVNHRNHDVSKRTYTYFTMPFMYGYQNNYKQFLYSFKTGLMMSLVVHENVEKRDMKLNNVQILNEEYQTYRRIKTNWHYALNLGLGYQLSNRWAVMIEPSLRYYLKDLYKQTPSDDQENPYSLGLNTSIHFSF